VLIVLVLVGLCAGGSYLVWLKLKPRILSSPEYRVGPEEVEITPLPPWIHSHIRDFRAEVFRDPTLAGPLWIIDDGLTDRIAKAFSQHPWVAQVVRVAKRYPAASNPASVKVELTYRQPVCMVEVPGEPLPLPVDVEGVLLPSEGFSPIEARRYPRLAGVDRKPVVPPGRRGGNATVLGGAEIAAALGPLWETMSLDRIVAVAPTGDAPRHLGEPIFSLITRSGTQILWGYAPGANALAEIPAAEKVARLRHYWAEHDTFDGPQGQRRELDVRTMRSSPRP
jgi:hypothetical protein